MRFGGNIPENTFDCPSHDRLLRCAALSGCKAMHGRNRVVIPGMAVPPVQQFNGWGICRVGGKEPLEICQEASLDLCRKRTPPQPITEQKQEVRSLGCADAPVDLLQTDGHCSLVLCRLPTHAPPQVDRLEGCALRLAEAPQSGIDVAAQRLPLSDEVSKRRAYEQSEPRGVAGHVFLSGKRDESVVTSAKRRGGTGPALECLFSLRGGCLPSRLGVGRQLPPLRLLVAKDLLDLFDICRDRLFCFVAGGK